MLALDFGRFVAGRFVPGSSFLDFVFGRFLGVLILVPRRFLKRFIPGLRLPRLLRVVAGGLWLAGCFKGVSWEGPCGG